MARIASLFYCLALPFPQYSIKDALVDLSTITIFCGLVKLPTPTIFVYLYNAASILCARDSSDDDILCAISISPAARVALETADVSGALLASSVFNLVPRARLTAQRYVVEKSVCA